MTRFGGAKHRRSGWALGVVGLVVGVLGASLHAGPAPAATKTTKPKTSKAPKTVSGTGDRLRPDYSGLPTTVAVRRAAKARGPRTISGLVRFVQEVPVGDEGQFLLKGAVDLVRRKADIKFTLEGVAESYLFIGDEAFQKVQADRVEAMGGSWIRSTSDDSPRPTAAIVMDVAFAAPDVVISAPSWKEKSTAADKAKKLRRLSGFGLIGALPTFNPDRFEPNVPVEVVIDRNGLLVSVRWKLVPNEADDPAQAVTPVEFRNDYGPLKTPLVVTAPEDDVVDYAEAGSAPAENTPAA
jgi:hypothetical protein